MLSPRAATVCSAPQAVEGDDPAWLEAHDPLSTKRRKRLLANAGAASGVELTSHSFRHFAASALISAVRQSSR